MHTEHGHLTLEAAAKRHILEVLDAHRGNISKTARVLDVDRRTLHRKLEKWGIVRSGTEHVELVGEAR